MQINVYPSMKTLQQKQPPRKYFLMAAVIFQLFAVSAFTLSLNAWILFFIAKY